MARKAGRRNLIEAGAKAAASAGAGNALIHAAGSAAGVGFTVSTGTSMMTVGLTQVVTTSALAVLAGTAVAVLLGARRVRWLDVGVVLFTVASLGGPLSMGVGTGAKLSLAAMHLVAASSLVVWLRRAVAGVPVVPADADRPAALAGASE